VPAKAGTALNPATRRYNIADPPMAESILERSGNPPSFGGINIGAQRKSAVFWRNQY